MRKIFAIFFFFITIHFFSQKISGKTLSENDMIVTSVLVVNISNNQKVYSNSLGEFSIEAAEKDEIRFIKKGYERASKKVTDVGSSMNIILVRIPEEIEEVEIISTTGNLAIDSKRLTKIDKKEQLQKDIGLPRPPEITREKAPELSDAFVVGFPMAAINIDALYKVVSGDARRMKNQYKYDDLQRNISWITSRLDPEYFYKMGIPKERINEFLEYAFLENPQSLYWVKKRNFNATIFEAEKTVSKFVDRLKKNNPINIK